MAEEGWQRGGARPGFRRVLIAQPIHPSGPSSLAAAGFHIRRLDGRDLDGLRRSIASTDILIVRNLLVDAAVLGLAKYLVVIGVHGVGTDAIDLAEARSRGVLVFNTPGANAISVAEHTMALLLAAARRIGEAHAAVRAGDHAYRYRAVPIDLAGRVLGLVGAGRIALEVAARARAFGMTVIVWSPSRRAGNDPSSGIAFVADLPELLRVADVISVHVPLVPATRAMIGRREFALMRPGVIVVNTARGGIVDESALLQALESGGVAAAGLDVFVAEPPGSDDPLALHPRVVATPHIAGSGDSAMLRTSDALATGVLEVASNVMPRSTIDPSVWPLTKDRLARSLLTGRGPSGRA